MEIASPAAAGDVAGRDTGGRQAEAEVARLKAYTDQLQAQITELEAESASLRWVADHDELTGLPNRRLFYAKAPHLLSRCARAAVVVTLDLNGFKPINDALGHDAGDHVLRVVARRITSWAGGGLAARLGGDEFGAVLTCARPDGDPHWWRSAVDNLHTRVATPIEIEGRALRVTASIGVALADGSTGLPELLRRADVAMYRAKSRGCVVDIAAPDCTAQEIEIVLAACGSEDGDPAPGTETSFRSGDAVWIRRDVGWRPGVVESASNRAVLVRYRYTDGAGTGVDTVSIEDVAVRSDADPHLDGMSGTVGAAA